MCNSWFRRGSDKHAMKSGYLRELECSAVPMWIFDVRTLAFLAVNDAAVQNYGYSREQFLAITVIDIRPSEDSVPRLQEQESKHYSNREIWRPSGGLPFEVPYEDVKRWKPAGDKFRELCRKAFRSVTK